MLGWHFSTQGRTLGYGDDRLIEPGVTHTVECEPFVCEDGLHASRRILDALTYAPGPYIWRVELGGQLSHGLYQSAATERTYLWGLDATDILPDFARRCVLDAIHLLDDAPKVIVRYLKTGDPEMRATAEAAAKAILDFFETVPPAWCLVATIRIAAETITVKNAYLAAHYSAYAVACDAADVDDSTSQNDAWVAAFDAARAKQNRRLTAMVVAAHRRETVVDKCVTALSSKGGSTLRETVCLP